MDEDEYTFQPEICPRSDRLVAARMEKYGISGCDVASSLYDDAKRRVQERQRKESIHVLRVDLCEDERDAVKGRYQRSSICDVPSLCRRLFSELGGQQCLHLDSLDMSKVKPTLLHDVVAAIAILREDNLQRAEFEEWKAAWDRVMVSKFRADHDRSDTPSVPTSRLNLRSFTDNTLDQSA
jgi:hypothetical protein